MPAFLSNSAQVQLRESHLLRDGPGADDSAQFMKDAVWKGERTDPSDETPFRSLCHDCAWRCK
jgi:hypothetical protein